MMRPQNILIVGGAAGPRASLAEALEHGGMFRVTVAASALGAIAPAQSRGQRFDAIVVGSEPPDADASDLCTRLRSRGVRVPIIVLSEHAAEREAVRALDAGANDYVAVPFGLAELTARLRAQIREHGTSEDAVFLIGSYHFRPGARSLYEPMANRLIRLTPKEATVLKCLYRASGQPVARHILLQEVWGYNSATRTRTVETHIYRLRRKIEPDPLNPSVVVNDDGGYSLRHHGEIDTFSRSPLPAGASWHRVASPPPGAGSRALKPMSAATTRCTPPPCPPRCQSATTRVGHRRLKYDADADTDTIF